MSNRMYKSALIAGAMAGSLLWASTAGAVTTTIGLQEPTVNGGALTTVDSSVDGVASFSGVYGSFIQTISASGSPPNPNPADVNASTALNILGANSTMTIFVTVQDIFAPVGGVNFLSGFTANILPAGWTVQESSFLDTGNGLFTTTTALSDTLFLLQNPTGVSLNQLVNGLVGPYSITTRYILTATAPGTALSTINVFATPAAVPLPGALPLFIGGLAGLWALARRRGKKVEQTAAA